MRKKNPEDERIFFLSYYINNRLSFSYQKSYIVSNQYKITTILLYIIFIRIRIQRMQAYYHLIFCIINNHCIDLREILEYLPKIMFHSGVAIRKYDVPLGNKSSCFPHHDYTINVWYSKVYKMSLTNEKYLVHAPLGEFGSFL